jgi:hypothetical protein
MRNRLGVAVVVLSVLAGLRAEDVGATSSTVGYVRVTVPGNGGVALIGLNLKRANGTAPLKVSEIFGTGQLEKGDTPALADTVHVWDPDRGAGGGFITVFQRLDGAVYDAETLAALDPAIPAGTALFVRTKAGTADRQLFLAGEVVCEEVQQVAIPAGLSMFANPYVATLDLNHDVGGEWPGATAGVVPTLADNVWIWNPNKQVGGGYDVFFLHSGTGKWHRIDAPGVVASNAVLAVGRGAFYNAREPLVNQLTRPYPR